jgi:hypothetical protein
MVEIKGTEPKYHVFVYGTLLSPFLRRKSMTRMPGVKMITLYKCTLYKWKLFLSEDESIDYPFIRYTGNAKDSVSGEMVEVNDMGLSTLMAVEKGYIMTPQLSYVFNEKSQSFEYQPFQIFTPLDRMKLKNHVELKTSFASFCSKSKEPKWLKLLYKKR